MHDYPYPMPAGLDRIKTVSDWSKLKRVRPDEGGFNEQRKALNIISKKLKNQAYFIDTIFSPWSTAHKLCRERLKFFMQKSPDVLLESLDIITDSFVEYLRTAQQETALSGIFLSLGGASYDIMTDKEYEVFGRPFDLRVLKAVKKAPFNVLHIHGNNIHFKSLLDYPVQAVNWSHWNTKPDLKTARKLYSGCLIAGVNETNANSMFPDGIKSQILNTVNQAGDRKLIIGPGCAVPTETPSANLFAFRQAVMEPSKPVMNKTENKRI
jgi:uroporphyrinogen decarboxylase